MLLEGECVLYMCSSGYLISHVDQGWAKDTRENGNLDMRAREMLSEKMCEESVGRKKTSDRTVSAPDPEAETDTAGKQ